MLTGVFELMDAATIRNTNEDFMETVRVKNIAKTVSKCAAVLRAIVHPTPSARGAAVVEALQTLYEDVVHDFLKPNTRTTLEVTNDEETRSQSLLDLFQTHRLNAEIYILVIVCGG